MTFFKLELTYHEKELSCAHFVLFVLKRRKRESISYGSALLHAMYGEYDRSRGKKRVGWPKTSSKSWKTSFDGVISWSLNCLDVWPRRFGYGETCFY
jgi:hypothetical protein